MKWYHLRNNKNSETADVFAHNIREAKLKCMLLLDWNIDDCTERQMNKR